MLRIDLLGSPVIHRNEVPVAPPRGAKAWVLLGYLLAGLTPPSRERLGRLLFPGAADPAGTLRWNLSQLRKALGPDVEISGDPVTVTLPPGTVVDLDVLRDGGSTDALTLGGLGQPFLAGIDLDDSPAATIWLDNERRHVDGQAAAALADASRARAARGAAEDAVAIARRLVELTPFDENAHALLVRTIAAAEGRNAAQAQRDASTRLLRRELGVAPSPALAAAVDVEGLGRPRDSAGRATIVAQLEAGRAAVAAGAGEAGIASLRRAVVAARAVDDRRLLAIALLEVGSALVHAARGSDEDGAAALHEAAALAQAGGDDGTAATAHRELGYIELLRAQYDRSAWWLDRARALAAGDDAETAWIDAVTSMGQLDTGGHGRARQLATAAVAQAGRAGDDRSRLFALASLGRMLVLRRDLDDAAEVLREAVGRTREIDWTGFLPWPEALLAEVDLLAGRVGEAGERFEHAFALGRQIGDPCWESVALRGRGLTAAAEGDRERALELLDEAPRRCRRQPDTYRWVEGYAHEALAATALELGSPGASRWVEVAERFASQHGMRELQVRALQHGARLGVPGADEAARALADGIDNPALHEERAPTLAP